MNIREVLRLQELEARTNMNTIVGRAVQWRDGSDYHEGDFFRGTVLAIELNGETGLFVLLVAPRRRCCAVWEEDPRSGRKVAPEVMKWQKIDEVNGRNFVSVKANRCHFPEVDTSTDTDTDDTYRAEAPAVPPEGDHLLLEEENKEGK